MFGRRRRWTGGSRRSGFFPKPKPSDKGVGIIARPATRRQSLELFYVTAAQNHVFRLKSGDQMGYDVGRIALPFVFSKSLQPSLANVILIGVPLVRQMAEFHRLDDAVHNHRGSQTRAQPQKQHLAAFVAPQSLHGRVIGQLHGMSESSFKIEAEPTAS